MQALPERLRERVVSAEALAVGWLETRSEYEMALYPQIVRIAHAIIAEGLSEQVIQPGVTRTSEIEWWYRERIAELKLQTWFHPSVSVQRAAVQEQDFKSAVLAADDDVVRPGDLVHVDFGITYLRLNTDTQQNAYVLRPGEQDAPASLKAALARGNRLRTSLPVTSASVERGTRFSPPAVRKPSRRASNLRSIPTRSVFMVTGRAPRSECGTRKAACRRR